ncbi:MAG: hypothetical protein AB4426_07360 [Xenococcaceae cyanobacterium]
MANILKEGDNQLVPVDYSDLLKNILRVLQKQNPFKIWHNQLIVDLDTIASEVANSSPSNPLLEPEYRVRMATVNFSKEFRQRFPGKISLLRDYFKQHLESKLAGQSQSIQQFTDNLAENLEQFNKNKATLDLSYPFTKDTKLQKQRLSIQKQVSGSHSLLKFHKLTITVHNTHQFDTQLREGLQTYIDDYLAPDDENDQEELNDILEELVQKQDSDFYKLRRLVDTEVLGQLKKEAKIKYLEYLHDNINPRRHPDVIYLQDLIRRLKLIYKYINNPNKPDGDYEVNYQGVTVNLRQLLSRSEAFDALPIIPVIAGYLGETTDKNQGRRQFIFGLKLKFNGKAQSQNGKSAFDYHLNLINPDNPKHQEKLQKSKTSQFFIEKVFKLFFLYYFIFASRCQPLADGYNPKSELEYDPISSFDSKILPVLQGDNEEQKKNILRTISDSLLKDDRLQIKGKIDRIGNLLKRLLNHHTILKPVDYPRHISVPKVILENDMDSIFKKGTFFKEVVRSNPKEALQYISVGEAKVNPDALCQLPACIRIEDIRYSAVDEQQQFSMEYALEDIKALPVLLVPKNERCRQQYTQHFKGRKLVVFPYHLDNGKLTSQKYFVYCFTFFLLTYICLKVLLDEAQQQLFIPILRLHLKNRNKSSELQDLDKHIAYYSKVLSHLLNEEHLSSSQGFDITNKNPHKTFNTISSLYSVIPKNFCFHNPSDTPQLEKLAIMIVSSRECDGRRGNPNREQRISNLVGEVVTVNRLESGAIQLRTWKTLADNYLAQRMYRQPAVILDAVNNLYRQGYRHLLYIAKAPYTSSLNLTHQPDDDDGLFFLSRDLISYLHKHHEDIKLYPIFFDKYYVRKLKNYPSSSLYIQDTGELTGLVDDPSQKAVVFFNLFNKITIGRDNERFYNGVISYATLLNIYQGILDDQDIRQGLIYDTGIKNDILQYLTLFHFSRYEKAYDINLKLDPYQNIIGDESVGKRSLFKHMGGDGEFNCLAFLTEVRKALWKPQGILNPV